VDVGDALGDVGTAIMAMACPIMAMSCRTTTIMACHTPITVLTLVGAIGIIATL
jgi:hypothetical protein